MLYLPRDLKRKRERGSKVRLCETLWATKRGLPLEMGPFCQGCDLRGPKCPRSFGGDKRVKRPPICLLVLGKPLSTKTGPRLGAACGILCRGTAGLPLSGNHLALTSEPRWNRPIEEARPAQKTFRPEGASHTDGAEFQKLE